MSRNIFLISLTLALVGLGAECITWINLPTSENLPWLVGMLKTLRLGFYPMEDFYYYNSGLQLSYLNVVGYVLLLAGTILYKTSAGKEVRLIRCIVAVILICSVFGVLSSLIAPLHHPDYFRTLELKFWILFVLRIIELFFLARLTRYVLRQLNKNRSLTQPNTNQFSTPELLNASFLSRLLNYILDSILCIAILFPAIIDIPVVMGIFYRPGGLPQLILLFALGRLMYYTFFEITLHATPGKLFTETLVVNSIGQIPSPGAIITRSACRLIPFDAFSFLGRKPGWHDSLSGTRVIKEV